MNRAHIQVLAAVIMTAFVVGCDQAEDTYPVPPQTRGIPGTSTNDPNRQSIFGQGGLDLFGNRKNNNEGEGGGIGVNAYLWRATLDTVSFLPLSSADPFGGVIITDWYQPPETPNERFKLSIFILDRQLRADGIHVSVFRQVRGEDGNWVDAKVDAKTGQQMEDAILTRARELRIAAAAAAKS